MRWAGRCRRGSSPPRRAITLSGIIRCWAAAHNGHPLVGGIYSEDEIWSCTTCGACEAECPLLVEYIDKIVDLRRGMVDDGKVPQSLQKPLKALESRGNPFGKMEKKKADWVKAKDFQQTCNVRILNGEPAADTLVLRRQHHLLRRPDPGDRAGHCEDSRPASARISASWAPRKKTAATTSGGSAKRRCSWRCAITTRRPSRRPACERIVTSDPHAYNALKHDYKDVPPVEHISQVIAREVKTGKIKLNPAVEKTKTMSTPITIPAIWGGTTGFTTTRATCWMRFPD